MAWSIRSCLLAIGHPFDSDNERYHATLERALLRTMTIIYGVTNRRATCRRGPISMISRLEVVLFEHDPEESAAANQLLPLVYDELKHLAAAHLAREQPGITLSATALVHEAYLRVVGGNGPPAFQDQRHFFTAAATAMRRILVDQARRRRALKRGGAMGREPLDDVACPETDDELLALHDALEQLAASDPLKAKLVELRHFAGLTGDQAAAVLGISPTTADRHWAFARAWLKNQVHSE